MQVVKFRFPDDADFSPEDNWKQFLLNIGLGSTINSAAAACGIVGSLRAQQLSTKVKEKFNVPALDTAVALAAGKGIIKAPETERKKWPNVRFESLKEPHAAVLHLAALGCSNPEICLIFVEFSRHRVNKLLGDAYLRLGTNGRAHRAKAFARWFWNGPAKLARPLHLLSRIEIELLGYLAQGYDYITAGQRCQPGLTEYGVQWLLAHAMHKTGTSDVAELIAYARDN